MVRLIYISTIQLIRGCIRHLIERAVGPEAAFEISETWPPWHNDQETPAYQQEVLEWVYKLEVSKDALVPPPQKQIGIPLLAATTARFEEINDEVIERPEAKVVECVNPLGSIV